MTDTTKRKPWMKWYTSDWRGEPTLRMVSRGARSVWVDLLGLMHESTLLGTLLLNGRIPSLQDLAKVLGDDPQNLAEWMDELQEAGVYSVDESGAIYSRKMRHAAEISEKGRQDVRKRGGAWAPGKKKSTPKRSPIVDPNRGATRDPIAQRLDTRTKEEEPELTVGSLSSVSSPPEIQNPVEPLLVLPEGKPHQQVAPLKAISSKINRGTRWPADAVIPDDWIADAAARRKAHGKPPIDLALEAEKFQNFWSAKSGKDATKVDWRATWRNWTLNTNGAYANGKGQFGRAGQLTDHPLGIFAQLGDELRERSVSGSGGPEDHGGIAH